MECKRCGECCRKGGPALHKADLDVLATGVIRRRHLFTLRKGEQAWDHARGVLSLVEQELIKIKGMGGEWTCCLWNPEIFDCSIYKDRPAECRALNCWDTAELEAMYAEDRLGRRDLVNTKGGLWSIIEEHEERCAVPAFQGLVESWRSGGGTGAEALVEALRFDEAVRDLLCARAGADPAELDFLLGRPLVVVAAGFGVKARKWGDGFRLVNMEAGQGREGGQ